VVLSLLVTCRRSTPVGSASSCAATAATSGSTQRVTPKRQRSWRYSCMSLASGFTYAPTASCCCRWLAQHVFPPVAIEDGTVLYCIVLHCPVVDYLRKHVFRMHLVCFLVPGRFTAVPDCCRWLVQHALALGTLADGIVPHCTAPDSHQLSP
jgi:hypothetical protein